MGDVLGEHGLAQAVGAEQDEVTAIADEFEGERALEQVALDLLGPVPVEVGQGLEAADAALADVARTKLKATIGFTLVLHTWNQQLGFHPHLHCLAPAGGLALERTRWISTSRRFFLPVKRLRQLFRGKLLARLERALRARQILGQLDQDLALLRRTPKLWHVYAKASLAGPAHVVRYLSRYVHRIALANSRITDYDGHNVTFRYKDRADGNAIKHRTLSGLDFARLFLQHVLPPRFVRILLAPV